MKSMLSGVDFSTVKWTVSKDADYMQVINDITDHDLKLRTALVAALGVIDAYKATDSYPGVTAESIVAVKARKAELETALEPFKVTGDDAKDGAK